ncbi:MAG: asparagine synthetase B, partial [candidate division KSB1 bacterium]
MCGICGTLNFSREDHVDAQDVQRMNDAIFHRGPDDEGYYIKDNVGLAMRRLSIIDLSTGKQP